MYKIGILVYNIGTCLVCLLLKFGELNRIVGVMRIYNIVDFTHK